MHRKHHTVLRAYQAALHRHLQQGTAASLRSAWLLGRRAAAHGLATLDLALIHEQALLPRLLAVNDQAARDQITCQAQLFFSQAVQPIEEKNCEARHVNVRLNRLNLELRRRTTALAISSRQLKQVNARQQILVKSLLQSEQQNRRLLEQARLRQCQMRLLSHRLLLAQEDERKRISRELHDVIAQTLTGINVRLATLNREATANFGGLRQKIVRTQRLVEKSVNLVHSFARELRPPVLDDLGLIPALQAFAKQFSVETGIRVRMILFAGVEKLSSPKRMVLFRVAQEALSNVARHAHASCVDLGIQKLPQAIRLTIHDDGQSFPVEQVLQSRKFKRLGLLGMRERVEMVGGRFRVESAPKQGTTICAEIPFTAPKRGLVRKDIIA